MSEQMQMIIMLFIFAFLIGFFIAHFIRKGAYKKRYEEKIDKLGEEEKKTAYIYAQAVEKEKEYHSAYDKVHQHYKAQRDHLEALRKEESLLIQQITSLEEEQKAYQEKIAAANHQIAEVKEEITKLSAELDNLRELREIVAKNEAEIDNLKEQLHDKQQLAETYLEDIDKLKTDRKELRLEAEHLSDEIVDLKQKLFDITRVLKAIERKYRDKIDQLIEENSDLKIKALNYEYAVKEYEKVSGDHATKVTNPLVQKIFRMPDSKTKEIDNIVKKNDNSRWIDKLKQKFFSKSNIAGKEI